MVKVKRTEDGSGVEKVTPSRGALSRNELKQYVSEFRETGLITAEEAERIMWYIKRTSKMPFSAQAIKNYVPPLVEALSALRKNEQFVYANPRGAEVYEKFLNEIGLRLLNARQLDPHQQDIRKRIRDGWDKKSSPDPEQYKRNKGYRQ